MLSAQNKQFPAYPHSESELDEVDLPVEDLVAADLHKVAVFKRYHIDYCCDGKKTLRQCCDALNIDLQQVREDLRSAAKNFPPLSEFENWEADHLIDYIYHRHHKYYYEHSQPLAALCENVAAHHGSGFPQLLQLKNVFKELQVELKWHLRKEENILFPFVIRLVKAHSKRERHELLTANSMLELSIFLEMDHDAIIDLLGEMKRVTKNYEPPAGACNSFEELYSQMQLLDADLRQHLALESNLLFPKITALEKDWRKKLFAKKVRL